MRCYLHRSFDLLSVRGQEALAQTRKALLAYCVLDTAGVLVRCYRVDAGGYEVVAEKTVAFIDTLGCLLPEVCKAQGIVAVHREKTTIA